MEPWQACQRVGKNGSELPCPISLGFNFHHNTVASRTPGLTCRLNCSGTSSFPAGFSHLHPWRAAHSIAQPRLSQRPCDGLLMVLISAFNIFIPTSQNMTQRLFYCDAECSSPLQGHCRGRRPAADSKEQLSPQPSTPGKCTPNFLELYKSLPFSKDDVKGKPTKRWCHKKRHQSHARSHPTPLHCSVQLIQVWHQLIF